MNDKEKTVIEKLARVGSAFLQRRDIQKANDCFRIINNIVNGYDIDDAIDEAVKLGLLVKKQGA